MENNLNYAYLLIQNTIALTSSYVTATIVLQPGVEGIPQLADNNQLVLLVEVALGDVTSCELQFSGSNDGVQWFPETVANVTSSAQIITTPPYVIAASGNYRIPVQLKDNRVRIQFKCTGGTGAGSSIKIGAVVGVA